MNLGDKIIINFHNVANPDPNFSAVHPCSLIEFERQIDYLKKNYEISSIKDVFNAGENLNGKKICAITFDDCLLNQYQNALPVLEHFKVKATFFPITATFEGYLPYAHKLHLILSRFDAEKLVNIFNDHYPNLRIPKDKRVRIDKRLHEDVMTANLKETLLSILPEIKADYLENLFNKLDVEEKEANRLFFMRDYQVKDLHARGFWIGSHTHRHLTLENLQADEFFDDLDQSISQLQKLLGVSPEIFSYPHGRFHQNLYPLLANRGFKLAMTNERRAVDINELPYSIPRFDTNDLRDLLYESGY